MWSSTRIAVLLLTLLMVMSVGKPVTGHHRLVALATAPLEPASVTTPDPDRLPAPLEVAPGVDGDGASTFRSAGVAAVATDRVLPPAVAAAYSLAVAVAPAGCQLTVPMLAAIGQVESGNLEGRLLDAENRVVPGILGPVLDGTRHEAVPDTDDGIWDGDRTWDRAVGPMQLIPSSWRVAGVDLDGDGVRDPQDIDDAAGAAMVYLCAGGRNLLDPLQLEQAILSYNHSPAYVHAVLAWKQVFDQSDLGVGMAAAAIDAWAVPMASMVAPGPRSSRTSAAGPATPIPDRAAPATTPVPRAPEPTTPSSASHPASTPGPSPAAPPPAPVQAPEPTPSPVPGPTPVPTTEPTPEPAPEPAPGSTPPADPACPPPTSAADGVAPDPVVPAPTLVGQTEGENAPDPCATQESLLAAEAVGETVTGQ